MELQLMPIILGGKNLDENRRRSIFIGEKSKLKEYKTFHVMIISLYKAVRKTISKPFFLPENARSCDFRTNPHL